MSVSSLVFVGILPDMTWRSFSCVCWDATGYDMLVSSLVFAGDITGYDMLVSSLVIVGDITRYDMAVSSLVFVGDITGYDMSVSSLVFVGMQQDMTCWSLLLCLLGYYRI